MTALMSRELRLAMRAGSGALTGLLFFLAVIAVIPFGVGPDMKLLARIGPAILWIGALLASLLGLDRLFQIDREDGSLDLMTAGHDFFTVAMTVFAKGLAHWLVTVLPLVIAAPLLGLIMNMEPLAIGAAALTLLVGTPAVTFIGAVRGCDYCFAAARRLAGLGPDSATGYSGADLWRIGHASRCHRSRPVPAAVPDPVRADAVLCRTRHNRSRVRAKGE